MVKNQKGISDKKSFLSLIGKIFYSVESFSSSSERLEGKRFLAVAGDLGGWHALLVVLNKITELGGNINIVFTGPSAVAYENKELKFDANMSVLAKTTLSSLNSKNFQSSLVLVAPSQSEAGNTETLDIVRKLAGISPILIIEDMWGSSVPFLKKIGSKILKNTTVCVVDEFAKKLLALETNVSSRRVFVTGGPQFDRVTELRKKWNEQRQLIRENIAAETRVFLVAGGVNGTNEILMLINGVVSKDDKIILRQHSRSTDADKKKTNEAIKILKKRGVEFFDVDKNIAPYSEYLLPGVDFVLSGFSTTLRYAIVLGMAGTTYVGTKSFKRDLWKEKKLRIPPEVEVGAGWYVKNEEDLKKVVEKVIGEKESIDTRKILQNQLKIAKYCDGKASERILSVVEKMIDK